MRTDYWDKVSDLFQKALPMNAEERKAFLDEACEGDESMRQEVESLLEADQKEGFTEHVMHAIDKGLDEVAPERKKETRIGSYEVLRKLGDGGMGSVYLASPIDKPYKQNVAVKVLKRGMDTEDILRRFKNERQILAALNHPNIAKLFDGGMTDDGRPYFVMSYIEDALPIDKYCDQHKLSVRDRLRLFQSVCDAVQYAHQNLIVHRDLKPSNILVSSKGTAHLLDFGIAKILNPALYQQSMAITGTDIRLMTPEYASPEQVMGQPITTATDVYSLGVLLYKLLTGHQPYKLNVRTSDSIADVICNTDPERPSSVVRRTTAAISNNTETSDTGDSISLARSTPPRRLTQQLAGDLDNIVMMALKKEPMRRYISIGQFSEDVERYLNGQPVVAQKDTVRYRVRKFVGRHKVSVASMAAIFLMVVGFGIVMAIQSARIAEERDRAELALAKSESVTDFLMGILNMSNPFKNPGEADTIDDLLRNGVARADELSDQPEVRAHVLDLIGNVYISQERDDLAKPLLEEALEERRRLFGENHLEVATSLNSLALLHHSVGELDIAEGYYRQTIDMRRELGGIQNEDVPRNLDELGLLLAHKGEVEEAEEILREGVALRRQLGEQHRDMANLLADLGGVMRLQDREEEGLTFLEEALAIQRSLLGNEHPDVARTIRELAILARRKGDYSYAERLSRESLDIKKAIFGEEHADIAEGLNSLAIILKDQGRKSEAETLYIESLEMKRRTLGYRHASVASTLNNLGSLLMSDERYAEAEPYYLEALDVFREHLGEEHRSTNFVRARVVELYDSWGQPEKAAPYRQ